MTDSKFGCIFLFKIFVTSPVLFIRVATIVLFVFTRFDVNITEKIRKTAMTMIA